MSRADVTRAWRRCQRWGQTPLWKAAKSGDGKIIQLLLQNGADVNAAAGGGRSRKAATERQQQIVHVLVENGDVNAPSPYSMFLEDDRFNDGDTPLLTASERGHGRAVQLLLRNGADVNAANEKSQTPLSKEGMSKLWVCYLSMVLISMPVTKSIGHHCGELLIKRVIHHSIEILKESTSQLCKCYSRLALTQIFFQ
jgi:hypothetical protein